MLRSRSVRRSISRLKASRPFRHKHDFEYNPLDSGNNEIRLLHLSSLEPANCKNLANSLTSAQQNEILTCSLEHRSLAVAPPYRALSYTWGKAPSDHVLQVGNSSILISHNLHQALKHIYEAGFRWVWVDAICINQRDLDEKSRQILRLATVFRGAVEVLAWVGLHDPLSSIVFEYLKSPQGQVGSIEGADPTLQTAIRTFAARDYWSRVWVVQEFAVAAELRIMCGTDIVPAERLEQLNEAYAELHESKHPFLLQPISMLMDLRDRQSIREGCEFLKLRQDMNFWTNQGETLAARARTGSLFKSTDILDQIYGLLGLVNDANYFILEPNYHLNMNDLLIQITKTAITNVRRLDFILLQHGKNNANHENFGSKDTRKYNPRDLPSWCPDYINLDPSAQNQEVINAIYPNATSHGPDLIMYRQGTYKDYWSATGYCASRVSREAFSFTGNELSVRGRTIGMIGSSDQWIKEAQEYATSGGVDHIEPIRFIGLLSTYCKFVAESSEELDYVFSAIISVLKGRKCQLKTGTTCEHCWNSRQKVISTMTAHQIPGDLTPYLLNLLVGGFHRNAWSEEEKEAIDTLACDMIHSLYLNFFKFERKVVGYFESCFDGSGPAGENWKYAWAPQSAQAGDQIWLLSGCSMPVVLRSVDVSTSTSSRKFTKIGPAVVYEAMTGGMWSAKLPLEKVLIV